MEELAWIKLSRECIGIKEIKGSKHNHTIVKWLDDMGQFQEEYKAWWREDETPWCGLFVGWIMGKTGRYVVKEWYRAKEWVNPHLTHLDKPAYGAIAVLSRKGGGHVGFVVGRDAQGNIMLLGGNQGDMVQISPFKRDTIDGYYWPSRWIDGAPMKSVPYAERYQLPLLQGSGLGASLS